MPADFFRESKRSTPNIKERYKKLGLRDNPFPQDPGLKIGSDDERVNGNIYESSIRDQEQEAFLAKFVPHADRPNVKQLVFIMDHATRRGRGIGKTSFLFHQARNIKEDWGREASGGAYVLGAVIVQPQVKTRKFWELSRCVTEALVGQDLISRAICRLRYTCLSPDTDDSVLQEMQAKPEETIGDDTWLRSHSIEPYNLNQSVQSRLIKAGIPELEAFTLAFQGVESTEYLKAMTERRDKYWRDCGDEYVYNCLPRLFQEAGLDHVLLLVDNVERIVLYQNASERREFVDTLRFYLVESPSRATESQFYRFLLTIHPYIQELLLPHWNSAGMDRFAPLSRELASVCTIYFGPLQEEQSWLLIRAYLSQYRVVSEIPIDEKRPFEAEAVAEAVVRAMGVPGELLRILHELVEKAADKEWEHIPASLLDEFMGSSEPPKPNLCDDSLSGGATEADLRGRGLK